jgi:hypothetical protein
MGFQPAYKYKTLVELAFERGRLQIAVEHSDAIARYRERLREFAERPTRPWYLRWFRPLPEEAPPSLPFAHRY